MRHDSSTHRYGAYMEHITTSTSGGPTFRYTTFRYNVTRVEIWDPRRPPDRDLHFFQTPTGFVWVNHAGPCQQSWNASVASYLPLEIYILTSPIQMVYILTSWIRSNATFISIVKLTIAKLILKCSHIKINLSHMTNYFIDWSERTSVTAYWYEILVKWHRYSIK